jgi:hypothetical protein
LYKEDEETTKKQDLKPAEDPLTSNQKAEEDISGSTAHHLRTKLDNLRKLFDEDEA